MIRNYKDDLLSDQSWFTGNSILISGRGGGCEAEDGNEGEIGQNSSSSVVVGCCVIIVLDRFFYCGFVSFVTIRPHGSIFLSTAAPRSTSLCSIGFMPPRIVFYCATTYLVGNE